jgi:hypothetical protein
MFVAELQEKFFNIKRMQRKDYFDKFISLKTNILLKK